MKTQTQPKDVVLQLFHATDQKDWSAVEACFAPSVQLDYSSMGSPAATLKPNEITTAWKTILPGFIYTHHQIGNLQESIQKNKASLFAYGTATHFLEDEGGNVWTVVGSYDFELTKQGVDWKINAMTFHFKYQAGNTTLPQKAINIVKGGGVEPSSTAQRNKSTVKAFLKAVEAENAEAVAELFAEEGEHHNPYHSGIFPEGAKGKEEIKAYWAAAFPNFDGMAFPITEIRAMEDPSIIFIEFKGKIKLKNDDGYYTNDYYATFKFNAEGKIEKYVEIFNPITAAKSFGLLNNIK